MKQFLKYIKDGSQCKPNGVSNSFFDTHTFMMQFDKHYWFNLETQHLKSLATTDYIPENIEVYKNILSIGFNWGVSLNHLFYQNLAPSTWKQDVSELLTDLESKNIYKLNFYPHTFFYCNGKLKMHDVYACFHKDEKIKYEDVKEILSADTDKRFAPNVDKNGYLMIEQIYSLTKQANMKLWPEEFL